MITVAILAMIMFVAWIAFRGSVSVFPFLAEYVVYANWAIIVIEIILAVTFVLLVIARIRREFRNR